MPAALLSALALGACGGNDEGTPALSAGEPLGEGGTLVWAVADEVSGIDVDAVERAVLEAYGQTAGGELDAATLEHARRLEPRHAISALQRDQRGA
jgi:hypothetical protein